MTKTNDKKYEQLNMPIGTASHRLHKSVMFWMSQKLDMDICHQCGKKIKSVDDFTIEHKIPWLDSEEPDKLFFDLENIAFSHHFCNVSAARRKRANHGTYSKYLQGCRCQECRSANATNKRITRGNKHILELILRQSQ